MARIPDAKRQAVLDDIRAGQKSRNQIARDHGISVGSVTNIAREAGLTTAFDRSQTKEATAARQVDTKAARALEAEETLTVARHLRAQILNAESGRDAQGWAVAYGIMLDKHLLLDKHDSDNGVGEAASLLGGLLSGLQAKHGTEPT